MVQISSEDNDEAIEFTREQVWLQPHLYIFQNEVYDLTEFYALHPGGRQVLQVSGGIDVTSLFFSMHRQSLINFERYSNVLRRYKVGKLKAPTYESLSTERLETLDDSSVPTSVTTSTIEQTLRDSATVRNSAEATSTTTMSLQYETEFSKELFTKVLEILPIHQWYAPRAFWLRTMVIIFLTLLMEFLFISYGRVEYCVLVGILHSQIGLSIQHDASHGALSRKAWVNDLFAYGADWIGNTRWLWFQQHIIGHHPSTNDAEIDPDATSAEPFLLFQIVKDESLKKFYHPFQHLFMYPVLSLYGPSVVFNFPQLISLNHGSDVIPVKHNKFLSSQIIPSILLRMFYYLRVIILPYYVGNAPLWLSLFGVNLVAGFCLTFVFVLSHNFVGSCRFPKQQPHQDWNKMQIETSCTYGGFLSSFLTGGLNFQIEHHLFPRMCSWHYNKISPIVRQVCEKHGVNYTYFPTILHNMASTVEYMRLNGVRNIKVD
jgi:fatty acid desaturase (delta-4 desaturase)